MPPRYLVEQPILALSQEVISLLPSNSINQENVSLINLSKVLYSKINMAALAAIGGAANVGGAIEDTEKEPGF